jgi:hypothetical protein
MTQPDGWQSPYDPPQQNDTGAVPGQTPTSGRAEPPGPAQQPYQQPPEQTYQYQPPYPAYQHPEQGPGQQPGAYQPGQQPGPYQSGPYQFGPYQPQPAPYGAPYGYSAPGEKNALGVWSLVLGIVSIFLLMSCGIGFLAAIPAIITGHLGRKAQKEGLADNGGLALGGIITGWVTIGLTILAIIGIAVLFSIPEFREGFFGDTGSTY